jgi:EAL domain-containing protein (putative c-di-GMP-specific phosphodiesterase class I)
VSPCEFIPIAEETNLIVPLGRWVLRQACGQMVEWQKQSVFPSPLTMSVNLSQKQLAEPGLVEDVERILTETGLDARSLRLELTESAIMENAASTIATLQKLKQMNVGLEIDDFGTGYSSLSYLRQLPFDTLKIDRSFIKELGVNAEGTEIVGTILKLAESLSMNVVAEGIETDGQLARLTELGCDYGQGFYFSKAVDPLEAEHLASTAPYAKQVAHPVGAEPGSAELVLELQEV